MLVLLIVFLPVAFLFISILTLQAGCQDPKKPFSSIFLIIFFKKGKLTTHWHLSTYNVHGRNILLKNHQQFLNLPSFPSHLSSCDTGLGRVGFHVDHYGGVEVFKPLNCSILKICREQKQGEKRGNSLIL